MEQILEVLENFQSIISGLIAVGTAYFINYQNRRTNEFLKVTDQLNDILKTGIQYPYLENDEFVKSWNSKKTDAGWEEKYDRYDLYCTMIFNLLERMFDYYNGDKVKIEAFLNVKEWVRQHKAWFQNPSGDEHSNVDGYSKKFREFVKGYYQ